MDGRPNPVQKSDDFNTLLFSRAGTLTPADSGSVTDRTDVFGLFHQKPVAVQMFSGSTPQVLCGLVTDHGDDRLIQMRLQFGL